MIDKIKKMDKKRLFSIVGIGLITFIIAVIVIINIFFVNDELTTFKFSDEKAYIYFGDQKFEFTGNVSLDSDNNVANITINGEEQKLYSEPIYYKKKDQIILPTSYSIVYPKSGGRQYKVNYFSMIKKDKDYYINNKDLNTNINDTFLFDGKDYYIFLNDAVVSFNGNEINISPMSFVNYVYDSRELYIYNYDEKKIYYFDNISGNVFVSNDLYKVNLRADSLEINGKNKLLMKNFDYLKKLK